MSTLRRLVRRLRRLLVDEDQSAPYVWAYTRSGSTIRGVLVGRDAEAYTLEHADVAPEGASGFRQVRGRVRIPREQVDYYMVKTP